MLKERDYVFLRFMYEKAKEEKFEPFKLDMSAIEEQTGFPLHIQRAIRKSLVEEGILKETFKGIPRMLYYQLDEDALEFSEHLEVAKKKNVVAQVGL